DGPAPAVQGADRDAAPVACERRRGGGRFFRVRHRVDRIGQVAVGGGFFGFVVLRRRWHAGGLFGRRHGFRCGGLQVLHEVGQGVARGFRRGRFRRRGGRFVRGGERCACGGIPGSGRYRVGGLAGLVICREAGGGRRGRHHQDRRGRTGGVHGQAFGGWIRPWLGPR